MGGGLGGFVVQGGQDGRGVRYSVQNGIRPLTLCSIITHMLKRRASLLKNRAFIQGLAVIVLPMHLYHAMAYAPYVITYRPILSAQK